MNKKSLLWLAIAIALLLTLSFLVPVFMAAYAKGFYFIGGGLIVLFFIYLSFKKAEEPFFFMNKEKRMNAAKLSNIKKFSLAMLSIVCIGVIGGFTSMRIDSALKANGVITTATISGGVHTKTTSLKKATENTYDLDFTYTTATGEKLSASERVSSSEYSKVGVGSVIEVIYLPDHPKVMRLLLSEESKVEFKPLK